jgi:hypothetical protein
LPQAATPPTAADKTPSKIAGFIMMFELGGKKGRRSDGRSHVQKFHARQVRDLRLFDNRLDGPGRNADRLETAAA